MSTDTRAQVQITYKKRRGKKKKRFFFFRRKPSFFRAFLLSPVPAELLSLVLVKRSAIKTRKPCGKRGARTSALSDDYVMKCHSNQKINKPEIQSSRQTEKFLIDHFPSVA